ncbi:casein kinase II regulatory subunit-domain-containing protein [Lactifluus subvellereus]|nr:casein kinase II regulatory subunit-domain-containing protein [Lactifluus subvellereus]
MSRRPQQQAPIDTNQPEVPEDELLSATGEGDEVMEEAEEQEGYTSSTPTSSLTWISWFCSLPGHDYFCEVAEDFIEDDFNLTGLNAMVPFWKEAMEMVLDVEPDEDSARIPDVSIVEASAELLYGLVHQRYVLTRAGLHAMAEKYEAGVFGSCPRVFCMGCNVVPCGRSDLPGLDTVKLFCPNCNDIYVPASSRFQGVDGAFFGTTFAHLFFQTYRELMPAPFWKQSGSLSPSRSPRSVTGSNSSQQAPFVNPNPHGGQKRAAGKVYVPRIYGFKVSERAKSGPRMQWMRLRPESPEELDEVDWRGRWIDDEEDQYDDGIDGEAEEDRRMEDFDPVRHMFSAMPPWNHSQPAQDHADDDDDDDDEDEEEEEESRATAARGSRRRGTGNPNEPTDQPLVQAMTTGSILSTRGATSLGPVVGQLIAV